MAFKVYLSPSNQPDNTYNGVATNERDNCREIAKLVKTELERCGITVKIGLGGSKNVAESNAFKPDLHIPIHTNAYNKKARGASVMVYSKAAQNLKYATPIFPLPMSLPTMLTASAQAHHVPSSCMFPTRLRVQLS